MGAGAEGVEAEGRGREVCEQGELKGVELQAEEGLLVPLGGCAVPKALLATNQVCKNTWLVRFLRISQC